MKYSPQNQKILKEIDTLDDWLGERAYYYERACMFLSYAKIGLEYVQLQENERKERETQELLQDEQKIEKEIKQWETNYSALKI
jgi:hypothetical protein